MLVSNEGNITLITQETLEIKDLRKRIKEEYSNFSENNIIVNITSIETVTIEDILEFLDISNTHRGNKHSFVIICNKIDIDDVPDELVIVPTLQEAYDIIEMEEMERDLGL